MSNSTSVDTNTQNRAEAQSVLVADAAKTITLDTPVGDGSITTLAMRKPMPGDLRGLKLLDVIQMDAAAAAQLVPRIALNGFTAQHFYQLQPADLLEVMTEIATFFTKEQLLTQ